MFSTSYFLTELVMLKLQKQQSCVCESLFKQITLEAGLQVTKS